MLKPKLNLELENLMNYELVKNANNHDYSNLNQAIDYLNSAIDTLEDTGFISHANSLINILEKMAIKENNLISNAKQHKPKNPTKVSDRHTKNLTSKQMIKNLKNHGTVFNMADSNLTDDLLSQELDFEDEKDAEYTHPDLIF